MSPAGYVARRLPSTSAGATIAAENGATGHQLQAIFGWETMKQVERYTRKVRRRKLAGEAMGLIVSKEA